MRFLRAIPRSAARVSVALGCLALAAAAAPAAGGAGGISETGFRPDGTLAHRLQPWPAGGRADGREPQRVEFTPNVRVDDDLNPEHKHPALAAGPGGVIYAAYSERFTHYNPEWMMFTRSTDHGGTWLAPAVRVNDTQPNAVMFPALDVMDDGTILLAWGELKFSPFNNEIRFSRSVDGGLSWSPSVVIHPIDPSSDYYRPSVLVVQGRILVAFWQEVSYPNGIPLLVYSDDGGHTWSDPAPITVLLGPYDGSAPCLAYNETESAVGVAFPANGERIMFSRSSDLGATWSAPVQVSDASATSIDYPDLDTGAGYFYATWSDNRYGQYNTDVFISRSTNGQTWTPSVKVNDAFQGNQYEPHLRADDHGNVHVCWIWNMPFQFDIDLYYSVSADWGATWLPTSARVNDWPYTVQPNVAWTSDILCDQRGNAFLAWNDGRATGNYDNIYCSQTVDWSAAGERPSATPFAAGAAGAGGCRGGAELLVRAQPGPRPEISLSLPRGARALRLDLVEVSGRAIGSVWLGDLPAGTRTLPASALLTGRRACSGRYLAVISDGNSLLAKEFVLLRP
jgi:hypothetical protein